MGGRSSKTKPFFRWFGLWGSYYIGSIGEIWQREESHYNVYMILIQGHVLTKTKDMYNNDSVVSKKTIVPDAMLTFSSPNKTQRCTVQWYLMPYVCNKDKSAYFFLHFLPHCVAFFYLSRRPPHTPLAAGGERENKLTSYDPPQKLNIDLATCNQIHTRQNGNKQQHVRVVAGHKTEREQGNAGRTECLKC